MSKLNLQINLNSYADKVESNQNSLNYFKWLRSISGITIDNPQSIEMSVPQESTSQLFNGTVPLTQDNTTKYTITLVGASSYKIEHSDGTAPNFRTERLIGVDNTTEVQISKNGSLATATFTDGTLPNLTSVVVGDELRIANIGIYKVLSKTATSISWENESQISQTIVLSDSKDLRIYSSSGVQKNQNVSISSGFSPATYGDYNIIDVAPDFIVITSPKVLPVESDVLASLVVYKSSKKIIYIESTHAVTLRLNGTQEVKISPLFDGSVSAPASILLTGCFHSAEVVNGEIFETVIYYVSAE